MRSGQPPEEGDEQIQSSRGWAGRSRPAMSRHYGGSDVYGRRRLVAGLAIVGLILILLLLFAGC